MVKEPKLVKVCPRYAQRPAMLIFCLESAVVLCSLVLALTLAWDVLGLWMVICSVLMIVF
ncbi:MAG: hypothetical protein ACI9DC_001158 [Gammaproteobacteria bacterium]|jgi:hypothetical protein